MESVEPFDVERIRRKLDGTEVDVKALIEQNRVWSEKFAKVAERFGDVCSALLDARERIYVLEEHLRVKEGC